MATDILTDPDELTEIYRDLLKPAFTPDELGSVDSFLAGVAAGEKFVTIARDDTGSAVGVAVGEWFESAMSMLLAYIAISPSARSGGIGSRLLRETMTIWNDRFDLAMVVAEVEHPAYHPVDPNRGDPTARLRFYERLGARVFDLPYFQPRLRPGSRRVVGMLLLLLQAKPALLSEDGSMLADPAPLLELFHDYSEDFELPPVDDSPEVLAFTGALYGESPIRLLPVSAYTEVRFPAFPALSTSHD
jgi:GNAT superfamily N-acetyltransferase